MSTAVTPTTTPAPKRAERRKSKVDHYFDVDAGEFARQHHLSVRAYCGVWISLSGYDISRPLSETGIDKPHDCKRCVASLYRKARLERRGRQEPPTSPT